MNQPLKLFKLLSLVVLLQLVSIIVVGSTPPSIDQLKLQLDKLDDSNERVDLLCKLGKKSVKSDFASAIATRRSVVLSGIRTKKL